MNEPIKILQNFQFRVPEGIVRYGDNTTIIERTDINENVCIYTIDHDDNINTMRIECRECQGNLCENKCCLTSLLMALVNEPDVGKINFDNSAKSQYFDKELTILKSIAMFSYKIHQLSLKTLFTPSGKIPKSCSTCQFYPHRMFNNLNSHFLCDINQSYQLFHDKLEEAYNQGPTNHICDECRIITIETLKHINKQLEDILQTIIDEDFIILYR